MTTMLATEQVNKLTYSLEQEGILENISCHVMEYSLYICFPHGKFYVTWNAMEYFVMSCV
jgi:hypothetical protein